MIQTISLCMVVFNEAHRIKETLNAIRPYVDEIVIVDQDSTDSTVNTICEWNYSNNDKGIQIIADRHWGYCEPSRKVAHQDATGDWILVLDADEQITDEFAQEMRTLDECGYRGARLKRSLWIAGEHRFTGDYQYRFFRKDAVKYLDEIHTEPQPTVSEKDIYYPEYTGIMHTKSWSEQARDENAYVELIHPNDVRAKSKLALNVYTKLLADAGITPEQADKMTQEEKDTAGIGAPDWARV